MKMHRMARKVACSFMAVLLVAVAGCGGGGGGDSGASSISGRVVDGYIKGASVCLDLNKNDVCDAGEPTGSTSDGGAYTLYYPKDAVLAGVPVLVNVPVGAVDESEGVVAKSFFLASPADVAQIISPFSTLAVFQMKFNPGMTYTQAVADISQKVLGSGIVVDPLKDFVRLDPQMQGAARALVAMMQESTFGRDQSEASFNALMGLAPTMAQYGYQNPTAAIADVRQMATTNAASLAAVTTVKVADNTYQATPSALAVGADNSLYAVDGTRVLKITQASNPAQNATVAVLASGLSSPNSVTVDSAGVVYFSDGAQIFKISGGQKTLVTGSVSTGNVDGAFAQAKFSATLAISADSDGNLRVADAGNNILRKVDFTSNTVSTFSLDPDAVRLNAPSVIYAGADGLMQVIDSEGLKWFYQSDNSSGSGIFKSVTAPLVVGGFVSTPGGFFLYTDVLRSRIVRINFGNNCSACVAVDPVETVYSGGTSAGNVDGPASTAKFNLPTAMVKGPDGAVYVADSGSRSIRKIK